MNSGLSRSEAMSGSFLIQPKLKWPLAIACRTRPIRRGEAGEERFACFHFGLQSMVTQSHPPSPIGEASSRQCSLFLMTDDAGSTLVGLKIRVSVVRFRPWPPSKSESYGDQEIAPWSEVSIRFPFGAHLRAQRRLLFTLEADRVSPRLPCAGPSASPRESLQFSFPRPSGS